jgi:hypothetical protein
MMPPHLDKPCLHLQRLVERIRKASQFFRWGEQQLQAGDISDAAGLRPCRRAVPLRYRWQPADRLLPRDGADDPRPPAGGGCRGRATAARAGHPVRRPERGRIRGGRAVCGMLPSAQKVRFVVGQRGGRRRSGSPAPRPAAPSSGSRATITAGSTMCNGASRRRRRMGA